MKCGAPPRIGDHVDCSTVQINDSGGERQAQPGATKSARGGTVGLLECIEDGGLLFRDDADARIGHSKVQRDLIVRLRLAINFQDNFLVTWSGDSEGTAITDIFTQQFGPLVSDVEDSEFPASRALWSRPRPS